MKRKPYILVMTAALSLGVSAMASAGDHRGPGYRDGARNGHAAPQHRDSGFRAPRPAVKRDMYRKGDRNGYYRDRRTHRGDDWRGGKYASKRWRPYWPALRNWRAQLRHSLRAAPRHRHDGRHH